MQINIRSLETHTSGSSELILGASSEDRSIKRYLKLLHFNVIVVEKVLLYDTRM